MTITGGEPPVYTREIILFQPDLKMENAFKFSRFDVDSPLSTCSAHPILLEDKNWLTCEHYYNTKIARTSVQAKNIAKCESGKEACELMAPWYRLKVTAWKAQRAVLMTRALYTKVQMYEEVKQALLATDDLLIVETSQYDYFWGIGRDARGENQLGKAWMNIRSKIKEA